MTTITLGTITARIATVVAGLTPAVLSANNAGFVEAPTPNAPLRNWARLNAGAKMIRLFEIASIGDRATPGPIIVGGMLTEQLVRVTVAYPTDHKLYAIDTRRDLEDIIAVDAAQIQGALMGPDGLAGAGHLALLLEPGIKGLDRSNAVVWFQDLDFLAVFYAQR